MRQKDGVGGSAGILGRMNPIAVTALSGANAAAGRFETAARNIGASPVAAGPSTRDPDLVRDTVGMIAARYDFAANLQVFRAADEMTGALLDIKI